jgi:hypothetical protein
MTSTMSLLAALELKDIFPYPYWQIPGLILVILLVIGWMMYRKRQM